MQIRLIVENAGLDEVAPQDAHPSADFIQAAIRAAKNSRQSTRVKIIEDVCDVLGCSKEDLDFLFADNETSANFDFPEYRREPSWLEAAE